MEAFQNQYGLFILYFQPNMMMQAQMPGMPIVPGGGGLYGMRAPYGVMVGICKNSILSFGVLQIYFTFRYF